MVDLVVVSYNTRQLIERCVATLRRHTAPGDYTLWVVDNASTDGSREWLETQADVHLIANRVNVGYARACNQAATRGQGEHIMFLNSDIAATPAWLKPLIDTAEADERIAVVGPKLVTEQGLIVGAGVVGTNVKPQLRHWMLPEAATGADCELDCLSVCGAAYLIKRRLIPILGLFDERYFFYFEETDYSYNARDKGYRVVYCPRSRLIHTWAASSRHNPLISQYFAAGQQLFDRKWAHMMGDRRVYGEEAYA